MLRRQLLLAKPYLAKQAPSCAEGWGLHQHATGNAHGLRCWRVDKGLMCVLALWTHLLLRLTKRGRAEGVACRRGTKG